jgi:hypothetical protein
MNAKYRWSLGVTGAAIMIFGLASLNYTKPSNLEAHRVMANEKGIPPPSSGIHVMGMGLTALGASAAGFALGRRKSVSA